MLDFKTKTITTETGRYFYKYVGSWRNPTIFSMEVLPAYLSKISLVRTPISSSKINYLIQVTENEDI